ncbi:IS66 family transposase [Archangium sp.]|uniref:IS66 family transposase n=1 Tax=Archangium sp. TaxID=1872627 RepID=UPI0032C220E3
MVDGYAAYQTATKSGADGPVSCSLVFCWAHVRRKFVEAQKVAPACAEVLSLMGQLYAIEADLPDPHALRGDQQAAALVQRLAVRQEKSAPLVLYERGQPGSRSAHHEAHRSAHHDGDLWPPDPSYLRVEVDRLSFGLPADLAGGQDTRPAGACGAGTARRGAVCCILAVSPQQGQQHVRNRGRGSNPSPFGANHNATGWLASQSWARWMRSAAAGSFMSVSSLR